MTKSANSTVELILVRVAPLADLVTVGGAPVDWEEAKAKFCIGYLSGAVGKTVETRNSWRVGVKEWGFDRTSESSPACTDSDSGDCVGWT